MLQIPTFFTLALLLATLLPLWHNPHWIIRSMDFPRLQLAILAFLLLFFQLWFAGSGTWTPWLLIFVTCCIAAWQLWWILPYTFLWPREVVKASDCRPDYRIFHSRHFSVVKIQRLPFSPCGAPERNKR
jgi:hypothetical protein